MRLSLSLLVLFTSLAFAEDPAVVMLSGQPLTLAHYSSSLPEPKATVLFLPGDGGWRGLAVDLAKTIASWGFDVYGFDTKVYLEKHSRGGLQLSLSQMAGDIRKTAEAVGAKPDRKVLLMGWSQGAGMAVAAVSGERPARIAGVLMLGLPETAVLGWDWKATLAVLAHQEPNQPTFPIKPLLGGSAGVPVWMIYGSDDEYTNPAKAQGLYRSANSPKQFRLIDGANHRFDGHLAELYTSIKEGLSWICTERPSASAVIFRSQWPSYWLG